RETGCWSSKWIYNIMLRSGMIQIEIVAGREQSAIALARGIGQRLLPAPGLDHNGLRQVRTKNLIPAFHDLAVLLNYLLNAGVEIRLQVGVALQRVGAHELLNFRIRLPFLPVYLIAADMKELVGKELRHLSDELVEELVSALASRVHCGIKHAPFP